MSWDVTMLVLTRARDESILIMPVTNRRVVIDVKIVRIRGNKVRLGVVATDSDTKEVLGREDVEVVRAELFKTNPCS